jgi:hypothetical protein
MHLAVVESVGEIRPAEWDALVDDDYPFLSHAFLSALERTGCVGGDSGWQPQFLLGRDDGKLIAAAPLYLKHHSYGEYVFDWAWASAYARIGLEYYPKLVAAVPFTPATSPRLLIAEGIDTDAASEALIDASEAHAQRLNASSIHWLFTPKSETARLEARGLMVRVGCQFHWQNHAYRTFDDFLASFSADKRKKVKRERRHVRDAGVEMDIITGAEATAAHWDTFYAFYRATIEKHGAIAYLTRAFFHEVGRRLGSKAVLVFARHGNDYVAGALNLRGKETLYGRYWGSLADYHSLHFETCYYQAIEYCITEGMYRFEAGAQGEHKIARGFLPTTTYSAHWLRHPALRRAVADFLARETGGMAQYMDELGAHSPFKDGKA